MSDSIAVISRDRWSDALDLLVARLPDEVQSQRRSGLLAAIASDPLQADGLLGHFNGDRLVAACWLERQAGRVATLWPPNSTGTQNGAIARSLIAKALERASRQNVTLVQSLLLTDSGSEAETLRATGFEHVADLLYLVSPCERFPTSQPQSELLLAPVSPHRDNEIAELRQVIELTYHGTRDCPALDGLRAIDDVLDGYRAVGRFRSELWLIARLHGEAVGCLLLADHAPQSVWELVYMGVVPEARGRDLGLDITRHAQWLAACENVERLVLAVDAANEPAIAMYAAAGFESWDRRSVFVWRPGV